MTKRKSTVLEDKFSLIHVDHSQNIREDYGDLFPTMADIGENGINLNLIVKEDKSVGKKKYSLVAGYRRSKCVERIRRFKDIAKMFASIKGEADQVLESSGDEELFAELWQQGHEALVKKFGEEDVALFDSWSQEPRQSSEGLTTEEDKPSVPGQLALLTYLRDKGGDAFSEKDVDFEDYTLFVGMLTEWAERTENVPIKIKKGTNSQLLTTAILENIDRKSMTPLEEAVALKKLIEVYVEEQKLKKTEAKKRVAGLLGGRSVSYVDQKVKLLRLCKEAKEELKAGTISPTQGFIIAQAKTHGHQREILEAAKSGKKTNSLRKMLKVTTSSVDEDVGSSEDTDGVVTTQDTDPTASPSSGSTTNPGQKLTVEVGGNTVVFRQKSVGGGDFVLSINDEDRISFKVTKKGYVKATSRTLEGATEILNVKTKLGYTEIRHDNGTEGQFLVDVDGKTKGTLQLDGKGGVVFESESGE